MTSMTEILAMAAGGKIKGVINQRPFEAINEALSDLINGTVEGRSVLTFE